VRGDLEAGEEALDDFILIKADGYPTYNFAHIIDDYHMNVTHIMRTDEFISSTPKFLSLYEALEIPLPVFVTLPAILREDRTKKLGKRDGARDVLEYRDEGYLPEAMMNFLALIGWNPGTDQELFTRDELIAQFSIEGIQRAGAVLNEEKLRWFNRHHLLLLSPAQFETEALSLLSESLQTRGLSYNETRAKCLVPIIHERIQVWSDIRTAVEEGEYDFAFVQPQLDPTLIPGAKSDREIAKKHLESLAKMCGEAPESSFETSEAVKGLIWPYADENGRGAVLWPLRYALTGRERSPDPFTVASLLGKAETELRITAAIEQL
jgi:glutamyl/glutaminyl-tRNA synthetase